MFPRGANRTRWLLAIGAGLSVCPLNLIADGAFAGDDEGYLISYAIFHLIPVLFAAVFLLLLRPLHDIRWWAWLVFIIGIAASHRVAFELAVNAWSPFRSDTWPAFVYAATAGVVAAGLAALLFRPARHAVPFVGTVLAASVIALAFVPLEDLLGRDDAIDLGFGLVDGAIAAVLGLRLFAGASLSARNTGLP